MIPAAPSSGLNSCSDWCALAVTWVVDDAAPAIKQGLQLVFDRTVGAMAAMGHESLDYANLQEVRKTIQVAPSIAQEILEAPQGVATAIFLEFADSLKTGGFEFCKGISTIFHATAEGVDLLFPLLINPVLQEVGSTIVSGANQTRLFARVACGALLETVLDLIHRIRPIIEESFSYLTLNEFIRAALISKTALQESSHALKEVIDAVIIEGKSNLQSAKGEVIKAAHLIYPLGLEIAELAKHSPLRLVMLETGSYLLSAAGQTQQGVLAVPSIVDETTYHLREMGQTAAQELLSFAKSGKDQGTKGIGTLPRGTKESALAIQHLTFPALSELFSYIVPGICSAKQGLKVTISASNEGTMISREILWAILTESGVSFASGLHETMKGGITTSLSAKETSPILEHTLIEGLTESALYIRTAAHETVKGAKQAWIELVEVKNITQDPILAVIDDQIALTLAGQQEIAHTKLFLVQDCRGSIEGEILDPIALSIQKCFAPLLARGRALRQENH